MNRVVATGLGIVSSIGNNAKEVITSLREGRSGIVFMPEMQELGFRCCVYGPVKGWDPSKLRKRAKLTMSAAAQFAAGAALEALRDAGLEANDLQNERIGGSEDHKLDGSRESGNISGSAGPYLLYFFGVFYGSE
jgi:3-oxoacyl-[acyl-carrier-protein] synthase-1